jgi:UDP-sugar transporter A1/2/3
MECLLMLTPSSLVTLSLQNAFLAIIMHYSRISTAPSQTYSAAAAVLMNEMLKCAISSLIALKRIDNSLWEHQRLSDGHKRGFTMFHKSRLAALRRNIFSSDCYKLAMPAILYVVQNNLQYVAISNLDVATFQVTNQMKILTTAFFSVLMLGKRLSRARWGALVLLAVGVCIVQLQTVSNTATTDGRLVGRVMHPMRGFLAVTLASVTSGIAGVYFELLVKSNGSTDLWTRNTQLSLFSLLPALMPILFSPHPGVSWSAGVASRFANFNGWAIGTVLTQTFGGLLTAIVIRYSDNILKGFATSLSIVISFLASVVLFNYTLTAAFLVGASIVLAATWMYNSPTAERTSVAVAPGSPIPSSAPILGEHKKRNSIVDMLRSASTSASDYVPAARLPPPLSRTPSSTPSTPYHSSPAQSYIGLSELRKPIVGVNTLLGGK